MSTTRHIASDVGGVSVAASTNGYCPPVTGALVLPSTEASGTITFRSAGTISNLRVRVVSGNRSGSSPLVNVLVNGSPSSLSIDLAPGGSPVSAGEYVDTDSVSISAGDTVSIHAFGGGSGNANWTFTLLGFDFTATTGTVTHFGATGSLAYSTASETSYRQPACGPAKTTTQAQGEWLVKLPSGVSGVTLRKLYVRASANTRTADTTITVNGATGSGTAPNVTIAGSSGATTQEDQSNEIIAQGGDKISFKVVTGAGASETLTIQSICVEVYSAEGVSFFIAGSPGGASLSSTNFKAPIGGLLALNTTESRSQATVSVIRKLSLASAYFSDGTTGTFNARAGAANVGSPADIALASSDNAWVTDSSNTYTTAAADLINWNWVRTATAVAHCLAITVTVLNVFPTGPTVSVSPGAATVENSGGSLAVSPTGPTVTVTPGAPALKLNVAPTGPSVSVSPGTPAIGLRLAPTRPIVTVTPGTASVAAEGGTQAIAPTGPTVTVSPGTPAFALAITPVGATVSVTAGTATVEGGQAPSSGGGATYRPILGRPIVVNAPRAPNVTTSSTTTMTVRFRVVQQVDVASRTDERLTVRAATGTAEVRVDGGKSRRAIVRVANGHTPDLSNAGDWLTREHEDETFLIGLLVGR